MSNQTEFDFGDDGVLGKKKTTGNYTLDYLVKTGQPLTVKNYIQLDTMGDASCLDDLEGENRATVEQLIEAGLLVDTVDSLPLFPKTGSAYGALDGTPATLQEKIRNDGAVRSIAVSLVE